MNNYAVETLKAEIQRIAIEKARRPRAHLIFDQMHAQLRWAVEILEERHAAIEEKLKARAPTLSPWPKIDPDLQTPERKWPK